MGACPRFALKYGEKVEGAEPETPFRPAEGGGVVVDTTANKLHPIWIPPLGAVAKGRLGGPAKKRKISLFCDLAGGFDKEC
jgi:hypothetical protein